MSSVAPTAPATAVSTWKIDSAHSNAEFAVKHMMISTVRGRFRTLEGAVHLNEAEPARSSVEAAIDTASVDTAEPKRDDHLRSADFFDVETYPTMEFRSTGVRIENGDFLVDGNLTIKGITKPVTFDFDFGGFGTDPWGNYKAGATAKTVINREDFGLTWNAALETGGVLVGKDVTIELDLQGSLAV